MASLALSPHLVPFTLFLLTRTLPAAAQTYTNLTQGTTLTPLGPTTSWPSPSGDFAFGFRPLDSNASLFLLAIWFNATNPQTIVWFANGNNPVEAGSKLELTSDGQLSLTDQTGNEVWTPGVRSAPYASLLDTGNLILYSSPPWQSFSSPTDTLLPGQLLTPDSQLYSRLTDSNFSTGRFALVAQTDGNLVLYPVALPAGNFYHAFWATGTMGSGSNSTLVFNMSGDLYYALSNGTDPVNMSSTRTYSTEDFYRRATLDVDGVFTVYIYPKKESGKARWGEKWTVVTNIPSDLCTRATDLGSGVCGFNSYCVLEDQRPDCRCPSSYSFMDPAMKFKGCKPDFEAQTCEQDESDSFELETAYGVDWPNEDYEHYMQVAEENCRSLCLSDCMCAVAVFRGGECWKKKLPLSNGMTGDEGGKLFIKVPKDNGSFPRPPATIMPMERNDRSTSILLESLLLGGSGLLNLILIAAILAVVYCYHKRSLKSKLDRDATMLGLNLRIFSYEELEEATKGFSEELGSGSFGAVYKGLLPGSESTSSTSIAVKKLHRLHEDSEKEFTNEVRSIGQTHHKNLVRLFGFCSEGTHRILVYEYMCNGSLTSFLFGSGRPSWDKRVQVAMGIARGLAYLHDECGVQIIHCDIKPQNILLDENVIARISDFGLAKLLRTDQSRTNTGIRGTRGYVAPEWFRNTVITAKVDVYSFGVMLLEIICCRKNLEAEAGDEHRAVLTYWAYDCYIDGRLDLLVGNDQEATADMRMLETFVKVAIWCIQEEPSLRPSMKKVNQMLEGAVVVSIPPDPSSRGPISF